jgi:hypothetical protein
MLCAACLIEPTISFYATDVSLDALVIVTKATGAIVEVSLAGAEIVLTTGKATGTIFFISLATGKATTVASGAFSS